jgi:lysophospholipase L1-like esterase
LNVLILNAPACKRRGAKAPPDVLDVEAKPEDDEMKRLAAMSTAIVLMFTVFAGAAHADPAGFSGSLPHWQTALSESSTRPASVVVVGDSISQGINALPSELGGGYVGLLTTALQSAYGNGGTGFQSVVNSPAGQIGTEPTYITDTPAPTVAVPMPWSSVKYVAGVPGGIAAYPNTSAPYSMTWPAVDGTTIQVWYLVNSSEVFNVSIDGATAVPVIASAGPGCSGLLYCAVTFTESTSGPHTVDLSNYGTALFFPVGVSGINATGVRVSNMSLYGQTMGPYDSAHSGAVQDASADMMAPDLVILALGVNDAKSATETDAQVTASTQTLVTAAESYGASVLVLIQPAGGYDATDAARYLQVEADELTVAADDGLAVYDPWALQTSASYPDGRDPCWYYDHGDTTVTIAGPSMCGIPGGYPDVHPNNAGHMWLEAPLLTFLES